ncbi:MAG: hypothetical protein ABIA66_00700 [Candidatus Omnitrophota bacterium]
MAITTYDGLIASFNNTKEMIFLKAGPATQLAGGLSSLWRVGTIPTQPAIPTATADTCTVSTLGAFPFNPPSAANTLYFAQLQFQNTVAHGVLFMDRVVHNGGLVGNSTAPVTLDFTIPTGRLLASGGTNARWFAEIYTDIGTTATTLTVNCTKSDGASVDIALAFGGASPANRAGRLFPILPSGDYSIAALNTARLTASTLTAGSYGFVLSKLITGVWGGIANVGTAWDFAQLNLPILASNSCCWMVLQAGNATTGTIQGTATFVEG